MGVYLYVTPFFPSASNWRGGYCLDFVRSLRKYEKVLVFKPGKGSDYEVDGVKVYLFKTRQLPSNVLPFLFRRYNERSFLQKVREVIGSEAEEVSVCHAHTANFAIYAVVAQRTFGCRSLLHHHDLQSFGLNLGILRHGLMYNAWLFCQLRKLFEQIDCHVFISEKSRESFLRAPDASWTHFEDYRRQMRGPRFFRCRPVRIKHSLVLHNGVDMSVFNHHASKDRCRGTGAELRIGCVGNFIDLKDQATLIRAVEKLFDMFAGDLAVKVTFVGSGPELGKCKLLAREVEDKEAFCDLSSRPAFAFLPEIRHAQLADFYRSLDLFVLPSYFEGFGCVFIEAWACGVPFITCEGQGMDEMLAPEERKLWLFRPGDAVQLADRIREYIVHRPQQHLCQPVSFEEIVPQFIRELAL